MTKAEEAIKMAKTLIDAEGSDFMDPDANVVCYISYDPVPLIRVGRWKEDDGVDFIVQETYGPHGPVVVVSRPGDLDWLHKTLSKLTVLERMSWI